MNVNIALRASLRPAVLGAAALILPTLGGFPGVICVTPLMWLLALMAGQSVVRMGVVKYASTAALSGALLGLLYGVLALAIGSIAMPAEADEQAKANILYAGLTIGGIFVCALVSVAMAAFAARRGAPEPES